MIHTEFSKNMTLPPFEFDEYNSEEILLKKGNNLIVRVQELIFDKDRKKDNIKIVIRGPIGSGKTLLVSEIETWLKTPKQPPIVGISTRGKKTTLVGVSPNLSKASLYDAAHDVDPSDFNGKMQVESTRHPCLIIFGREDFLRASGLKADHWLSLNPLDMNGTNGNMWIAHLIHKHQLNAIQQEKFKGLLATLRKNTMFQWLRWYELAAQLITLNNDDSYSEAKSPLEIFYYALSQLENERIKNIEKRLLAQGFALNDHDTTRSLSEESVTGAKYVLNNPTLFKKLTDAKSPFETIKFLGDHLEHKSKTVPHLTETESEYMLIDEMVIFLQKDLLSRCHEDEYTHGVYVQGLIGKILQNIENLTSKDQKTKIDFFKNSLKDFIDCDKVKNLNGTALWDFSDAVTAVGHVDFIECFKNNRINKDQYFKEYTDVDTVIGNKDYKNVLMPNKPLKPYMPSSVTISKVFVARYLVTVEQYREFYRECQKDKTSALTFYIEGKDWYEKKEKALNEIKSDFKVTKNRCLSAEALVSGESPSAVKNFEDRILNRALLKPTAEPIWSGSGSSGEHYKQPNVPVVDVTWWDAMAYCRWWTKKKMKLAGFADDHHASLLEDYQWEAIRRLSYPTSSENENKVAYKGSFGAHVDKKTDQDGRLQHHLLPVHVGLFPPEEKTGPYDMPGNVWEWTRTPSLARIRKKDLFAKVMRTIRSLFNKNLDEFEDETYWHEPSSEQDHNSNRNIKLPTKQLDLRMRMLRGSSFMGHSNYAWMPSLRTCDPPYYSFQDVGFRIAVYKKVN